MNDGEKGVTQVERNRIPWAKPHLFGNEERLVADALASTWISGGSYVDRLESEISARMGSRYGVTVANGTAALHLALIVAGVGQGDEVIVPGFTFVAAAAMTRAVGATVITADIDPDTWCLDVRSAEQKISERTRAIIPVHLYGNVAAMDEFVALGKSRGVMVIEDAAEAAFSQLNGRAAGTFGTMGTLSFHATKTMTTGEGGMVVTNDESIYEQLRLVRDHGRDLQLRYWHDVVGYNFRMTNLQAAFGCAQFENIDYIIAERARVYSTYRRELAEVRGIKPQTFSSKVDPVLWTMVISIDDGVSTVNGIEQRRDSVMKRMLQEGIETRPGFYPLSRLPPYRTPVCGWSERIGAAAIALPTFVDLTDNEISRVCRALDRALSEA